MDPQHLFCGEAMVCDPMLRIVQILVSALLGVLFTQSALDKVFDWSGNIGWITEHFSKTPFRNVVTPMVAVLTLMEALTGALCLVGALLLLVLRYTPVAEVGIVLAGVTLLQLFAGQRIARDYNGAAQIAPYFAIVVLGLFAFTI